MFFYRLKNFFALALSVLVALLACCAVGLSRVCKFSALDGARVFYLCSASSQSLQKQSLDFSDLFSIRGESVRFAHNGCLASELTQEILHRYNATVCFTEEVDGVLSVYAYTQSWDNALTLGGVAVNLHIAVSNTECVVGSPIIFGGF
ncbi:MAG: YwmB family TATA-box binding protein [Clostridia bacterium]|nr:YwmB family TATA-box binding protein [Clostridia bacterium]